VAAMRRASVEELATVPGMNRKVALVLHQHLMQDQNKQASVKPAGWQS
jgi:hypothetical protein